MRTLLATVALALAAGALLAPAGPAQTAPEGTVQLVPNTAGKPSTLSLDMNPQEPGGTETPRSVSLFIARGFRFDSRARPTRCSDADAQRVACPSKSRIGTGQAMATASGFLVPGGSMDFTASIELFVAAAAAGDVAGVVVQVSEPTTGIRQSARGRLVPVVEGPFGLELRFDQFPGTGQVPPGVTIDVKRIQMTVGAKRRVRKVKRIRRKGKVVKKKVRIRRYYLITNPPTCAASWPYQVRVGFPSSELVRDGTIACTA
jgi:hypothetical protein